MNLPSPSLQFGHGYDTVEINSGAVGQRTERVLQFGHGYDTVEMIGKKGGGSARKVLQFGHGYDTVEMPHLGFIRGSDGRFNSATAMTPWK